ncbi:MAG: hypothetical protein CBC29_06065 [Methylococcaceae bacterium TMED69]|nr:MAG: hypothetical protein CBC29_06065 [Methylococcaceae bacterium TMED69]|tara:strand:+ start:349 stop:1098 length:750 start_codon:yes stop_codon:yes gene_type:complete
MSLFLILLGIIFSCNFAKADDTIVPDLAITVEAHKNFEVYIAPVNLVNTSDSITNTIPKDTIFRYAAVHYPNMKIDNGHGGYERFNVNHKGKFLLYNQDTINYAWKNCDYKVDHKACAFQNNHWVLETNVTITNEQIVVHMILYDERLQAIGTATVTNTHKIKYIERQKTTQTQENSIVSISQQQQNCNSQNGSCPVVPGGSFTGPMQTGTTTITEDLPPEKIEFPVRLLEKHFSQASLRLWTGVRIDL